MGLRQVVVANGGTSTCKWELHTLQQTALFSRQVLTKTNLGETNIHPSTVFLLTGILFHLVGNCYC